MAILGIGAITGVQLGAKVGAKELAVVADEIDAVIKTLTDEAAALEESEFKVKGHISKLSFGVGEESTVLAEHHAKAHGVVAATLEEVIGDLVAFRTAVEDARRLVGGADEASEAELAAIVRRTDAVDLGLSAYDQARQNGGDIEPTNFPEEQPLDDYAALLSTILTGKEA